MIEYLPVEILMGWNTSLGNAPDENKETAQNAKFISSSDLLMLETKSTGHIKDEVNEFICTRVFLGEKNGKIECSSHNETLQFLVRKILINNPFIEKWEENMSNSVIRFCVNFKHKRRR